MVDRRATIGTLRSEYDGRLLDPVERKHQSMRLCAALMAAGLWPSRPRILDVGCGAGLKLAFLGKDVRSRIGCDIRREAYLQMSEAVREIRFIQACGMEMPFPGGCFDLVTCISVIEELPDFRAAIEEMARCVAPGGVLVVNVTNGVLLRPLYRLAEMVGRKIPESWWHYACASEPIVRANSAMGYHIGRLEGWRYVHVTPYMVQYQFPVLKGLPISWLDTALRRFTPTFVHAWQRPTESGEGR